MLAALLLWVRNGYGFLVLLVGGAGGPRAHLVRRRHRAVGRGVPHRLAAAARRAAAAGRAARRGRRRGRTSDPDQLAGLTRVPALVWMVLLLLANLAGLVVGVSTLAPDLV